jgi:hypothetical protein
VAKFESELTHLVADDKSLWDKIKIEPSMIAISERRIKIGVHNGWRYVNDPHTVHLSVDDPSIKQYSQFVSSKRLNLKSSLRAKAAETDLLPNSNANRLVMRNSVVLDDVFEDPMCAIVFQVEYVLNIPIQVSVDGLAGNNVKNQSDIKKQFETHHIIVRWGAYTPFADSLNTDIDETRMEINMFGAGTETLNPEEKLVFKRPDTNMQDNASSKSAPGKITFDIRKGNTVNFKQRASNRNDEYEENTMNMQQQYQNRSMTLPHNMQMQSYSKTQTNLQSARS